MNLKTLKDIGKINITEFNLGEAPYLDFTVWGQGILKDFVKKVSWREFCTATPFPKMVLDNELKAEAIKWIKYKEVICGQPIIEGKYSSEDVKNGIRDWIKHFFGISEGDLK